MGYNGIVFSGPLGSINLSASASLGVLTPLLAQVDFSLFGSFGVGAIKSDLQAQLSASLKASADISLGLVNPIVGFQRALAGILVAQAQLTAALAGGFPVLSVDVVTQISVLASFAGALSTKISALEAMTQAGIQAKAPAVGLVNKLQTALSAGPVFLASWTGDTLANVGASIAADFGAGLTQGLNNIAPSDTVYGILLVTKSPTAWAAISSTMLT